MHIKGFPCLFVSAYGKAANSFPEVRSEEAAKCQESRDWDVWMQGVLEVQPAAILPRVQESSQIKPTFVKAPLGPRFQTPASLCPPGPLAFLFHSASLQAGAVH